MANRHRGTDTDRAMRSRQVAEALGEDARASQKAFLLNFPFVQQSKEEFLRPDELDRKTAFELSGFLDKMASSLSQAVSAMAIPAEAGKLTQGISEYLSAYNRATAYVRLYGRTGKLSSREEQAIQAKFDSVKPSLEQILNAHAAGTPIPEFRAVLDSYDNINNNDLRPVSFSPPINIPQPAPPAGAPAALPIAPIVGQNVPRQGAPIGQPVQPAPQGDPRQPAPPQPQEPLPDIPNRLFDAYLQAYNLPQATPQQQQARQQRLQASGQAVYAWVRANRPELVGQQPTNAFVNSQFNAYTAVPRQPRPYEQYRADLAAYQQQYPPVGAPAQAPIDPQQPERQERTAAIERLKIQIRRRLEGRRLDVLAAEQALAQAQQAQQAGQRGANVRNVGQALELERRRYEQEMVRARRVGVDNIPYDPAIGAPLPVMRGEGAYGGVSADMAGMDDEYLDLMLHDGFQDRGNWSGMMKALQSMPTNPYGAGIGREEGEEMPYGTFGSAKRVAFLPDEDYISDEEEPEEEMEEDDMYDREIAGRQQLDDDAEKIQATRLQKELKTAKGSARNMRDMLDKLRGKIKCR
jgi:hypothetical protein